MDTHDNMTYIEKNSIDNNIFNQFEECNAKYKILHDDICDNINNMKKNRKQLNNLIDDEFKIFVDNNINNYNLLYFNDILYYVYLTDCSVKLNKNKEIIIQIIYNNLTNDIILWFRRGRINSISVKIKINDKQSNCSGLTYYNACEIYQCIDKFKYMFYLYTGYKWDEYNNEIEYEKKTNKYKIIKTKTLINDLVDIKTYVSSDDNTDIFIKKIITCNKKNNFTDHMYKLKLYNISEKKIYDGICILEKIKELYNNGTYDTNEIMTLTEKFIYCIPIICRCRQLTIITLKLADDFIKEVIDEVPYMNNIIHNDIDVFNNFNNILKRMTDEDPIYNMICQYVKINNGMTHIYDITVVDIFKYNKINSNFVNHGNNCYLFHGSRFSNIYSILYSGLKIAPKHIPRTGDTFGHGLYFANCSTKSFNYCYSEIYSDFGCLLLCKVSLGNMLSLSNVRRYTYETLTNEGYNSIKVIGKNSPKETDNYINNVYLPIGELCENTNFKNSTVIYDEYVCYNTDQVQIEYVIYCKHKKKKGI